MRVLLLGLAGCLPSPFGHDPQPGVDGKIPEIPDGRRIDGQSSSLPDAPPDTGVIGDAANVVTFVVVADAWTDNVSQQTSRQNFGIDQVVRGGGIDRNGFIRFDLSSLPANTVVLAGELDLYVESETAGAWFDMMLEPWDETTCTWKERQTGVAWSSPGGGRYASQDAGNYIATPTATAQTPLSAQLDSRALAVVTGWIQNPATNYGLGFVTVAGYFSFYSRESGRPAMLKLTIQ